MRKSRVDLLSKEEFEELVKQCYSYAEVLRSLGYKNHSGSMHKKINERIKRDNISTEHMGDISSLVKNNSGRKIPTEEILVENSKYSRFHLKNRLVKERLLEYKCEKCGNKGSWIGESISLQLDHINGANDDNRLENLRFLCPNCHSQTKTFGGKNIKKNKIIKTKIEEYVKHLKEEVENSKKCKECEVFITKKNALCVSCSEKKQRKTERPSYSQLKKEIENIGYSATGKKYGVSDNAIRKWKKYYEKNNTE